MSLSSALHLLNAPYSFCDKDLPVDRGLLYHTFHISSFYDKERLYSIMNYKYIAYS